MRVADLLQHPVVDVLNGLEPCHSLIVDVVRFIVEDGQFAHFPNDLAKIGVAIGGLADWLGTKWRKEVIGEIVVFQRWLDYVAEEDAMDVGEEDVSGLSADADIVLDVKRELEIIAPVLAVVSIVGQDWIVEEYL